MYIYMCVCIPSGADPSITTKDGCSALYLATFGVLSSPEPDITLLQELIKAGQ